MQAANVSRPEENNAPSERGGFFLARRTDE